MKGRKAHGWVRSSAGEHRLHTAGVTGSIPVAPTILLRSNLRVMEVRQWCTRPASCDPVTRLSASSAPIDCRLHGHVGTAAPAYAVPAVACALRQSCFSIVGNWSTMWRQPHLWLLRGSDSEDSGHRAETDPTIADDSGPSATFCDASMQHLPHECRQCGRFLLR